MNKIEESGFFKTLHQSIFYSIYHPILSLRGEKGKIIVPKIYYRADSEGIVYLRDDDIECSTLLCLHEALNTKLDSIRDVIKSIKFMNKLSSEEIKELTTDIREALSEKDRETNAQICREFINDYQRLVSQDPRYYNIEPSRPALLKGKLEKKGLHIFIQGPRDEVCKITDKEDYNQVMRRLLKEYFDFKTQRDTIERFLWIETEGLGKECNLFIEGFKEVFDGVDFELTEDEFFQHLECCAGQILDHISNDENTPLFNDLADYEIMTCSNSRSYEQDVETTTHEYTTIFREHLKHEMNKSIIIKNKFINELKHSLTFT